ncbi:iron complex transport system substrate-binding protein [Anaerovirgula multivorans]|uniref:Iron complex transport system substrate-binding protein n=1 Tax=Anaerovirgula multivorans TaxID=312168 RepID=A0A239CHZ0_9FIRM|nr:ABC transporter substrate-binding protein [Anaerovirgula multivorans]SNS19074.1 iron complex transport system substrate-binding protein [Anaerovirgula multivorans]
MKRKKITVVLAIVLVLVIALVGCGDSSHPQSTTSSDGHQTDMQTKNTVKDDLGREVTIPENPQRILALNGNTMEALFNLGITPVGKVEEYKIRQEGVELPSVGAAGNINIEAVYKLQPDLIIAHARKQNNLVKELENTGATVYYFNPDSVGKNPLIDVNTSLGDLLDKQEAAQAYIEHITSIAEELKQQISEQTDIKTAILIQDGDTITAAQTTTGYGSVLTLLGIENIVPENLPSSGKENWVPFDIESILANNPDLVLILAPSNDPENNKAVLKKFKNDQKWAGLDAVKNDKITILPFKVNPFRSSAETMLKTTAETILKISQQP